MGIPAKLMGLANCGRSSFSQGYNVRLYCLSIRDRQGCRILSVALSINLSMNLTALFCGEIQLRITPNSNASASLSNIARDQMFVDLYFACRIHPSSIFLPPHEFRFHISLLNLNQVYEASVPAFSPPRVAADQRTSKPSRVEHATPSLLTLIRSAVCRLARVETLTAHREPP